MVGLIAYRLIVPIRFCTILLKNTHVLAINSIPLISFCNITFLSQSKLLGQLIFSLKKYTVFTINKTCSATVVFSRTKQ
jgi:hypothetical protein